MNPIERSFGLLLQPALIVALPLRGFVLWPWERERDCIHDYGPPEISAWQMTCTKCGEWRIIDPPRLWPIDPDAPTENEWET